ncbi:hypothetical protein CROQUDRAFT_102714 [Cronartium quercuum f. sp. fusiforme G11]|uniref:Uncharacterized protein n=1 Tax=Cronartium quercuum f. sp. fusiforme G11 TaxID=708437 RepID=A0A9P6T4Z0_9BASI|nr:hypothetical protein CROQUDRAFT_102714 [Cronartium quercuum f. sp. fusiforme G11]
MFSSDLTLIFIIQSLFQLFIICFRALRELLSSFNLTNKASTIVQSILVPKAPSVRLKKTLDHKHTKVVHSLVSSSLLQFPGRVKSISPRGHQFIPAVLSIVIAVGLWTST